MRRRWELVSRDVNGRVIGTELFWRRRSAEKMKVRHDHTARGTHPSLTAVTAEHGPLFTNEVHRVS
jgi:hypothetical protein